MAWMFDYTSNVEYVVYQFYGHTYMVHKCDMTLTKAIIVGFYIYLLIVVEGVKQ
jgi:hypothetical protein